MIHAMLVRALALSAAVFAAASAPYALTPCLGAALGANLGATLGATLGADGGRLPAGATNQLSPELLALLQQMKTPGATNALSAPPADLLALLAQKNMARRSPILLRIFKEEAELEVWKQDGTGHFALLKVYPICRWSGDLGPKEHEGDRQAPEGFYAITPKLLNPKSNYYLAINTGFPNSFDKANKRDGSFLMIHGYCASAGCYAMTDEQIAEIFSLALDSFLGGRPAFQVQAYPFRLTPANLARHRTSPHLAFWTMLKAGNDHFEATHLEPRVDVCDRRYVFDARRPPNSSQPLVFDPASRCPAFVVNPKIAGPALEKARADAAEYARLVADDVPVAPIYSGLDGGMNEVFHARYPGKIIPLAMAPGSPLAQLPPVAWADNSGSLPGRFFGALFASTAPPTPERGADLAR